MSHALFDRLGGAGAVEAAVDLFYRKVLADPLLIPFFAAVDMDKQRAKQTAFLTMAFGGPNSYSGASLRHGHAAAVKAGLSDVHFDAVAGHLATTLQELQIPADLVSEVLAIAASTRNDVLGR